MPTSQEEVLSMLTTAQPSEMNSTKTMYMSEDQKPLSGFFDGKEFAYSSLRNPRFSLRRSLFLTSAYGAYGGNVESPK